MLQDWKNNLNYIKTNLLESHLCQHEREQVIIIPRVSKIKRDKKHGHIKVHATKDEESTDKLVIIILLISVVFVICLDSGQDFVAGTEYNNNSWVNSGVTAFDEFTVKVLFLTNDYSFFIEFVLGTKRDRLKNDHCRKYYQQEQIW